MLNTKQLSAEQKKAFDKTSKDLKLDTKEDEILSVSFNEDDEVSSLSWRGSFYDEGTRTLSWGEHSYIRPPEVPAADEPTPGAGQENVPGEEEETPSASV